MSALLLLLLLLLFIWFLMGDDLRIALGSVSDLGPGFFIGMLCRVPLSGLALSGRPLTLLTWMTFDIPLRTDGSIVTCKPTER